MSAAERTCVETPGTLRSGAVEDIIIRRKTSRPMA